METCQILVMCARLEHPTLLLERLMTVPAYPAFLVKLAMLVLLHALIAAQEHSMLSSGALLVSYAPRAGI